MTNEIKLPDLPEWSKMDDLGRLVPSQVRQALVNYAREHEKNVRAALAGNAKPAGRTVGVAGTSYAAILNVALPVGTPLYTNPPIAQDRQSRDEGVRNMLIDAFMAGNQRGHESTVEGYWTDDRDIGTEYADELEAALTPTNGAGHD